jgi:replication factor A1
VEKSRRVLRNKVSAVEYLAFLSVKYEVDPDEFLNALVSAGEDRISTCGSLSIECRGNTQDRAVFLIMKDSRVVAQFPLSREFLLERFNPIKGYMKTDMVNRLLIRKNRESQSHSLPIRDLRAGMSHVNLKAKVMEIPRSKLVFTRFGNYVSVANALIADETGTIKLCLWNEQIDSVSIGDTIQIENARTSSFRGERQLNIGRNGTLCNVEGSEEE